MRYWRWAIDKNGTQRNRTHALRAAARIGVKAISSQISKSYLMEHRVAPTIEQYERTAFITPG